jgi:MFS superfamily sulfate permease-like transporter
MFAFIGIFIAATVSLTFNHDLVTAINTALNYASVYLLLQAQRRLRKTVTPKLEHVEETVTSVAEHLTTSQPGGRRQFDPPTGDNA